MNNDKDKPNRSLSAQADSEAQAAMPILAKLGAELTGIPLVGPLANAAIDLFQERKARAREAMQRENDARLANFFAEMFRGGTPMDEKVADVMMDDADFHALLRACVADIEAEKVAAYAALARGIASGKVGQQWRRHFILSLRDFSHAELNLLRQAYVAKRHDMMSGPGSGGSVREGDVLAAGEPGSHQAILMNNLVMRGFVHASKISTLGETFTVACWREDQLTPQAMNRRTWSGHHVPILNYEIGKGTLDGLSFALEGSLLRDGVKSSIVAVTSDHSAKHFRMMSTMAVLLIGESAKPLQENLQHLVKLASKVPILVVDVSGNAAAVRELPSFGTVVCGSRTHQDIVSEVREKLIEKSHALQT